MGVSCSTYDSIGCTAFRQTVGCETAHRMCGSWRERRRQRSRLIYSGDMPHVIELFVAEHCPGCPDARKRVNEFAACRPDVIVVERRVELELETAQRYGLFATPAIVIDGTAVLYGAPTLAQLTAHCDRPVPAAAWTEPLPPGSAAASR